MILFLDTSSLFKLYHKENGTVELEVIFIQNKVSQVFLSELSKVEFSSTIWKKVRMKEISDFQAKITLNLFANDFKKFTFVNIDSGIIEASRILVSK